MSFPGVANSKSRFLTLICINIEILARNDSNCAEPNDTTKTSACELDENCMTMISQIDGNMIWERKCTQENVEAVGARCTQKVQGGKVTENTCKKTCTSKFCIHLYRISYTV